eukprot:2511707-Amphidinium_carterae.1
MNRKVGVTPAMLRWIHSMLNPHWQDGTPTAGDAVVLWAAVLLGFMFLATESSWQSRASTNGRLHACGIPRVFLVSFLVWSRRDCTNLLLPNP